MAAIHLIALVVAILTLLYTVLALRCFYGEGTLPFGLLLLALLLSCGCWAGTKSFIWGMALATLVFSPLIGWAIFGLVRDKGVWVREATYTDSYVVYKMTPTFLEGRLARWYWYMVLIPACTLYVCLAILFTIDPTSHADIIRDLFQLHSEAAGVLNTVKDRESAEAAATKLNAICERGEMLMKRRQRFSAWRGRDYPSAQIEASLHSVEQAGLAALPLSGGEPTLREAIRRFQPLKANNLAWWR
jgi:hypothetical protein